MAISQDVIVLNDLSDADRGGSLSRRERTTGTGTHVRYSMEIQTEPILHDFNGLRLGAGPARAMRDLLSSLMKTRGGAVSPSTKDKRLKAPIGLAIGYPSLVRRYVSARGGQKQPGAGSPDRLYYDSGTFADGLAVQQNTAEENWTINVPANRLDPTTFGGGEAALIAFWRRLTTDIPEFLGGQAMLAHAEIRTAIEQATSEAIYVLKRDATAKLSQARWQLVARIAKDALRILTI